MNTACKKEKEYVINDELNPDAIIKIASLKYQSLLADSNSTIIVRVQINLHTDSAFNVTLTTTTGLINGKTRSETMQVNVSRYADFVLTAGRTSGPVSLRASVMSTFFRDTTLNLTKSYPDTILIYPEAYNITKNSSVAASIFLVKNTGYPSRNQTLFLSATDESGNNLGRFTYNGTYIPGNTILGSFTPPVDYSGKIILQATVIKENGEKITGRNNINIQ